MEKIRVVAAVIIEENKVLCARRKEGRSMAGKWEFPGGKVKEGEGDEEALERELLEEFGARSKIAGLFCETQDERIILAAYQAGLLSGIEFMTDHSEIKWAGAEELLLLDFAPADLPIAKKSAALLAGKK